MEREPSFLPEPRVTFDREEGRIVSAFILLRDGVKAIGSVQPSPQTLVFFQIAADGLPIGIRFHEPASATAVCELLDTLVDPSQFLTGPEDLRATLGALKHTLKEWQDPAGQRAAAQP